MRSPESRWRNPRRRLRRPAPAEPGTVVSPADLYSALRNTGLHHGQAFAALTRIVRKSNGSSETEIVLPDEATAHRGYRIHPVMLDAALQGLAAAMSAESLTDSSEATYLPVSFEKIRVFGDVGRRARCRAELVNPDGDGAGMLGRVLLMDDSGHSDRRDHRHLPATRATPHGADAADAEDLRHRLDATTPVDPASPAPPEGSWLVLTDGAETEAIANDFIAGFGSPTRRVVSADLSQESAVLEAFAKTAADAELPPVGVVIFAGQQPFDGTDSGDAPARGRDLTWGVAATVRAIVGGWHGKSPRLWLVSRDGLAVNDDEPGDPSIGALTGLIRVLAYEHPDLRTTLVDLGTQTTPVTPLTTELGLASGDDVIAWRGEKRYAQTTFPRDARRSQAGAGRSARTVPTSSPVVSAASVWPWPVGWSTAAPAASSSTDESEPSDEARAVLAELGQRAQIVVVPGDISAPGVAERLVSAAEETGYWRCEESCTAPSCSTTRSSPRLSKDSLERVWAPKAHGALRLHVATADRELDWWVGFSSTSSLLGAPGQGAYAAASAWLDGLVDWRRASGLPATTINWGQWSDIGVARSLTFSALDPIAPAEGIEALEAILASKPAQDRGGSTATGSGRGRVPGDSATRLFRQAGRGTGYRQRRRRLGRPRRVARDGCRRSQPGRHCTTGRTHLGHHGLPEGQYDRRRSAVDRTGDGFADGRANPEHCSR